VSKGTQLSAVRIDDALRMEIEATIGRRNLWSRQAPWTLSDFLRVAVINQLEKMKRSRRPRPRRSAAKNSRRLLA
jgi:hypothetical protein